MTTTTDTIVVGATSNAYSGIVVGVDAGPASDAALELAADLAGRHRQPLLLVHAVAPAMGAGPRPYVINVEDLRRPWEASLADSANDVRRRHPSLDISTYVAVGNVAATLVELS